MARFCHVQKSAVISKEMFEAHVQPQLPTIQQTVLSITQDAGSDEAAE